MNKILFKGSAVALVTPYKENGKVNYQKLEELIEFQIANCTDAIVVCGTTGEASTMSDEVQINVVKQASKIINGRSILIAGAGSNDTKHGCKLSYLAQEAGADAILSVTPYYNKTSQKGLIEHYEAIASAVDIPLILYNVKSRTGMNIDPETVKTLSQIPNICGIKECNFDQVAKIKSLCGDDFGIYSGEDSKIVPLLSLGGHGVISVLANVVPKETHDMVQAYINADIKKAAELQVKYIELVDALFCEVNPIPVKTALNMMGMNVGCCIPPLTSIDESNYYKLEAVLKKYGLII